ncbi:hypothetical protein RHMOL_Rhmol02G0288900 [Rhododendron molle]|uniref:Uncharacterized protein n=1 Tax=Rhododendron molle TaxID=49168 RepID=A0ACC0PXS7_RHOML|nr:hypothetical protein RHMOL_Rhmol02G0288900 [Rhododendron molle]
MVDKPIGSGNGNSPRVPAIGLTAGVSWRDTVAPPSEESPHMKLRVFPPYSIGSSSSRVLGQGCHIDPMLFDMHNVEIRPSPPVRSKDKNPSSINSSRHQQKKL